MPDDLRRSWYNDTRNKAHAKCNAHGCIYINMLMRISQFVPPGSRKLLYSTGSLAIALRSLWWPRRMGSGRVEGRLTREGIYAYTWLVRVFAQQKLIQHCKIIIFQLKKCNILDSSQNHPHPWSVERLSPMKLVPGAKKLGTAASEHQWQKKKPKHYFLVLEYGIYQCSNFFSNNDFSRFPL